MTMRISRMLLFLTTLCASLVSRSQNEALFSHYYEVPSYYNPGAIGMTDNLRIRGAGRMQWVGIDNAPKSFMGLADMPVKIGMSHRIAVGAVIQQESMGLYRNLSGGVMLGYQIRTGGGVITPGVRLGIVSETFKGSEVVLPDDGEVQGADDAIPTTDVSGNTFDAGLGVSYRRKHFSAGISMLHLNNPTVKFSGGGNISAGGSDENGSVDIKNYEFEIKRTLYLSLGGNIPVENTLIEILPSMIAASNFDDLTGVATLLGRYNRLVSFGVGYRWKDAVIFHLGLDYRNFYLGYSYEYPTSDISKVSSGSHEIVAGYSIKLDLGDKNRYKQKSIRIM